MRIIKNIFLSLCMLSVFCTCLFSCKDDSEDIISYIELAEREYIFPVSGETRQIDVNTNVHNITVLSPEQGDWASFAYADGKLTITTENNQGAAERNMTVRLRGAGATTTFEITQGSWASSIDQLGRDIKLKVMSGTASSYQDEESGIEKSFDDDFSTIYHSKWNTTEFPVSLVYNFEEIDEMDYLVYKPRPIGNNGNFKEFDLYVSTEENPDYVKYGSYNFNGLSSASTVSFIPSLKNPLSVKFVVNSGEGNYVSCSEMEFYKKVPVEFDILSVFTDMSCSDLKPGTDRETIDQINNQFYRNLAVELLENRIDKEFRIGEYTAWIHPRIQAAKNKTAQYSLRDNPTGIYTVKGEELIVMANGIDDKNVYLLVSNPDVAMDGESFKLSDGANRIQPSISGLVYIMYHTDTGAEEPVKLHFVTGKVNGYFDSSKHTKDDWQRLLDKASFRVFDLVGKYAHMTFETQAFRDFTPDGLRLIDKYDDLVKIQQQFMGLFGTSDQFKNRMYFLAVPSGYMYAGSNHTGYHYSTQSKVLDVDQDPADFDAWWGPAHEVGHINQTRPGLKWQGMGEVTNNIFSMVVVEAFGVESRLSRKDSYTVARKQIIENREPHNLRNVGDDVLNKLVPFWQLKLYMHNTLGRNDFYPKVFETIRRNPNPATDGECQLEFVKICCDVAKLDFTEFFDAWGFLMPVDIEIDDYGVKQFTITQSQVEACKAYIASKSYPKPTKDITYITDNNINDFK